jgi:hypothetical protein
MGRAEKTYGIYAKARDMSGLRDYAVSQKTGVSSSTLTDWKKGGTRLKQTNLSGSQSC